MKILVTGGAGFIGSHVADTFEDAGHEVVVLDNFSTGQRAYVPEHRQLLEIDITDRDAIRTAIETVRPDIINHHAAHIQVGNSVKDPQFDANANIMGLLHIMEAARTVGVQKIIMASTGGAMYGNKQTPFTEEMKEQPLSPYGISKRSGELYLNYYHEQYGIPYIALRYANVYGPRQNPHGESGVIAIFAELLSQGKKAVINGDGTHTRDYVYVGDVARANRLALDSSFVGELNIGTSVETSTNTVYELVASALGITGEVEHGPERPGEQETSSLAFDKARGILGWEPTVQFDAGVQRVSEWYSDHK